MSSLAVISAWRGIGRIPSSFPEVVVASPDVRLLEARLLQRVENPLPADPREVDSRRGYLEVDDFGLGVGPWDGVPSFAAASR